MEKITIIDFHGPVQYETIGELIHELKDKAKSLGIQINTYKKILLVLIESLENIIKYHEKPDAVLNNDKRILPALSIEKRDRTYTIASSNVLNNSKISFIKEQIDYLNRLDEKALKEHYKNVITNGKFSQNGGAGLGLIEMAKISPHIMSYTFNPLFDNYSQYILNIKIDG